MSEEGCRDRESVTQKSARIERIDLEGKLMDCLLDDMLEIENDSERRKGIQIMREMHTAENRIHELRYFADLGTNIVPAKDRDDVLTLLDHINNDLSSFWNSHKRPEGTMWDKE